MRAASSATISPPPASWAQIRSSLVYLAFNAAARSRTACESSTPNFRAFGCRATACNANQDNGRRWLNVCRTEAARLIVNRSTTYTEGLSCEMRANVVRK